MAGEAMTMRDKASARWEAARPMVIGLAIGLVAGPIISSFAGLQVRSSTAAAATRAGIVEQQASFCAERARATMTVGGAPLDWQARNELARTWAVMPGTTAIDQDVVYACSGRLTG